MFKYTALVLLFTPGCWCVIPPKHATCHVLPDPTSSQKVMGFVDFEQFGKDGTLEITVVLYGFDTLAPDGSNLQHGLHIHEYGDLSEGCGSTGGHYNPTGANHGAPSDKERHYGDLGNMAQKQDGTIFLHRVSSDVLSLFGAQSIVGRAVVIHEKADDLGKGGDQGSLTTGNAGKRLACCSIGLYGDEKLD